MLIQKRKESIFTKVTINNNSVHHLHKNIELFYVLEGELFVTIDNETKRLTPGMFSVTFPYELHKTKTETSSSSLILILSPDLIPDFQYELFSSIPENHFLEAGEEAKKLGELLSTILSLKEKEEDSRLIKGYLFILFSTLLSSINLTKKNTINATLYESITEYLNQHFREDFSLSDMAGDLGYSKYYLSHLFKEVFDSTFTDLLRKLRCEYAIGLLTHSDLSITEICYESGFNSIRSFYRAFEELYGTSPREFSREKKK